MPCAECSGAESCIGKCARELCRREEVQSSVERGRAVEEGAALPRVQNGAGGASLRRCGAARVAMRRGDPGTGPRASTVAVNELRVKGPIVHGVGGVSERVGTHRESYAYDADAEGRAAQCE